MENIDTKIARPLVNLVQTDDVKIMLEKVRQCRKGNGTMSKYEINKCILYFEKMGSITQDAIDGVTQPSPEGV